MQNREVIKYLCFNPMEESMHTQGSKIIINVEDHRYTIGFGDNFRTGAYQVLLG